MIIHCTQDNLSKSLNLASHIAGKNVNLPILNNILIKTENKLLKLCSTNLEIGITSFVRCKIDEEGEIATEAKTLTDYINLTPKGTLEIKTEDNVLKIKNDNYQTVIKGSDTSEFPLIPTISKDDGYKISASFLKNALQQVVFAASPNDLRPEISGVLVSIDSVKKKLILVATDSYRLAEKKIDLEFVGPNKEVNGNQDLSFILPQKTAQEILRILSIYEDILSEEEAGNNIFLYVEDGQVLIKTDQTELISKLVEGQYPDYKQIIPQDFRTNIIIDKTSLQKAVKAASLFSKSGIYDILLKADVSKEELEVFAENSQLGQNSIKINTRISGENNDIVVNFKYLLDGLQNINTDNIVIDIVDNSIPCLIRPYKDEAVSLDYLYLVMPIRQ